MPSKRTPPFQAAFFVCDVREICKKGPRQISVLETLSLEVLIRGMDPLNRVIVVTFVITSLLGCSAVRSFVPIDEVIATDYGVTTEWQEIRPKKPMTSSHQVQMIMVKVDNAKLPDAIDNQATNTTKIDWNSLVLSEGKLATPELQLIDEEGVVHRLHGSMDGGSGRGYSVDSGDRAASGTERRYVALRIRSNVPFRAREIKWYTFDRK
jgi:hypothetical protein